MFLPLFPPHSDELSPSTESKKEIFPSLRSFVEHFATEATQITQVTRIGGERGQSAKLLPSKDLRRIPRSHAIKLDRLAWIIVPVLERKRNLGSLAREPSEGDHVSKSKGGQHLKNTLYSGLHMHKHP